jgi:hypothetical protein
MCCIDPWGFWQWKMASTSTNKSACDAITREHHYHTKNLGRREIVLGLQRAEQILTEQLGFPPIPTYRRAYVPAAAPISSDRRDVWPSIGLFSNHPKIQLPDKYVLDVGSKVLTKLGDATVNLTKRFSPAYDTFTLTLPSSSLVDGIEVYFSESDRWDESRSFDSWRVDPISWRQNKTTNEITITGRGWMIADPLLYENYESFIPPTTAYSHTYSLDPSNVDNFVQTLEVYSVRRDEIHSGKIIYEDRQCTCGHCVGCLNCADATFCLDDGDRGLVRYLGPVDPHNCCTCRKIVGYCIDYYAGDCRFDWLKILANLAVAEMGGCCICGCEYPCLLDMWNDISLKGKERTLTAEMLNNPLGLRMGQFLAYQAIQSYSEKDYVACF